MKILMLASPPTANGPISKIVDTLAIALRKCGIVVFILPWGSRSKEESLLPKIVERAQDIIYAWKFLRREDCDVMLIHTSHDWATLSRDIPLLLLTQFMCPHIVLQFHGSSSDMLVASGNFLFKFFSCWLVRLCNAALVLSSEEQREWQQFYPQGRFDLIDNPFVPDMLEISNFDRGINDVKKAPIILFVGRLIREKGILDLLDAIFLLHKKKPFHLLVVGDGPDAGALKEKIVHLGVAHCVTLAGYLKGKDLNDAYCKANIFVLPTYWAEGFPTVITEAMSHGLPIVTTRIRGAADHLLERVNAMFVQPKDPVALANVILTLLETPALRARMGQANREKVKEFAPDVVGRHYLSILEKIVESGI